MKVCYASRTGNVESIINRLDIEAIDVNMNDNIDEDYIIFTYTDGHGDIPYEVESFLELNSNHLKGVIVSGSKDYTDTYCMAGDRISSIYNVPLLYKVEESGTEDDIKNIKEILERKS